MAVTVIGGLAVATALTLIVIPVVYSLLAGRRAMAVVEEPEKAAGGPFRLMQVAVERIGPGVGISGTGSGTGSGAKA